MTDHGVRFTDSSMPKDRRRISGVHSSLSTVINSGSFFAAARAAKPLKTMRGTG